MAEKIGLAAAKAALVKKYGAAAVLGSGDRIAKRDIRVSSGSFELDMAMGGSIESGFGIIVGRAHAFWGDKSGGKTTTSMRVAGIFQGLCRNCWRPAKGIEAIPPTEEELAVDQDARWSAKGECDCYALGLMDRDFVVPARDKGESAKDYAERAEVVKEAFRANSYEETVVAWIDAEDAFEKRYFSNFGDPRRIMLVKPEVGEDAIDIAHVLASSGCIDLMVLDSLAHFVPKDEVEASAHEWQQGLQARIVNKGVRKFISTAHKGHQSGRRLTQIWINQTRMKLGVMFGDPSVKPAGMGQEFGAHVEIRFRGSHGEHVDEQWGDAKRGEIVKTMVSERFSFEVVKNRSCATKGVKGHYEQSPTGKVMEDESLYKMAMKFLVTEDKKAKDDKYVMGDRGFRTQKDVLTAIRDDPEVREAVRIALLARFTPGS
jgi:RecA/RadA recombinase